MRIGGRDFEDLVARRIYEWQLSQRQTAHLPEPEPDGVTRVVTLSRELGSGGNEIARILQQETEWAVWDRELVEEIGRSAHVRTKVVDSVDERTRSEIQEVIGELAGEHLGQLGYRRHLLQVILTIARHGRAVIVGRGANYLLPEALNVRIIAPMHQRVARVAEREGISQDEARQRCQKSDRERAQSVRMLFGKEIADPAGYDLVISTGEMGTRGAVDVIVAAMRYRFE